MAAQDVVSAHGARVAGRRPVPTYAVRYRFEGPGLAAFVVNRDGRHHLYARGSLGAVLPDRTLAAMLAAGGRRWVPATGELRILGGRQLDLRPGAPRPDVCDEENPHGMQRDQ